MNEKPEIIKCTCSNDYQDKTYGDKLRVHSSTKDTAQKNEYRCTVCRKINRK